MWQALCHPDEGRRTMNAFANAGDAPTPVSLHGPGNVGIDAAVSRAESVSFGPFRLDPAARRVEKDGVPFPLSSRALDILISWSMPAKSSATGT
jgi:hypothetical protein